MQSVYASERPNLLHKATYFFAGIGFLTASSYVAVPMIPVPVTLQSLAVLLLGAIAGPRTGFAMIVTWLAMSAAGFPVLADGKTGLAAFTGPTAGYLLAFPVAGFLSGLVMRQFAHMAVTRFLAFLALHGLILLGGFSWLSTLVGVQTAFMAGVVPFLAGAAIKSALGAAILAAFGLKQRQA